MQPYRVITMNSPEFQSSPEFLALMVRGHTQIAQALRARDEVAKRSLIDFTWGKGKEQS